MQLQGVSAWRVTRRRRTWWRRGRRRRGYVCVYRFGWVGLVLVGSRGMKWFRSLGLIHGTESVTVMIRKSMAMVVKTSRK